MRSFMTQIALAVAASALVAQQARATASLADICTNDYIKSILPPSTFNDGIDISSSSVAAAPVYDYYVDAADYNPSISGRDYCNVTMSFERAGDNITTLLWFWFPSPEQFSNRWLTTGGGGFSLTSGDEYMSSGLVVGAATGTTDGGVGGWDGQLSDVILNTNGSINYYQLFDFGFRAIHELTIIGQYLTKEFYNITDLYSYYQGCSEGGRDGMSQIQRYGDQFDGAVIGAPAFRQAFQQPNHLFSQMVEIEYDYYPSACELEKINNDTISACDGLDGRVDGVVARTDLCYKYHNASASVGSYYECAASDSTSVLPGVSSSETPAANGTVTQKAADIAQAILRGLHDSNGKRVYISYQPTATFADAGTTYNSETGEYEVSVSSIGAQWVEMFLKRTDSSTIDLTGITYDDVRQWMIEGLRGFHDTMQTTWPDLSAVKAANGKIIHYHGESDNSIPTASSVRYYESVREIMYGDMSLNASYDALQEFYRLYLIPGAGHCSPSTTQPNGPFPQTVLESMIDWVENSVVPVRLNATVINGTTSDVDQQLCSWPLRPQWAGNTSDMDCVYDEYAREEFYPALKSILLPVY